MDRVVKILMKRDGMTRDEALELIEDAKEELLADPDNGCEILEDMLGLEPDYIFDLFC